MCYFSGLNNPIGGNLECLALTVMSQITVIAQIKYHRLRIWISVSLYLYIVDYGYGSAYYCSLTMDHQIISNSKDTLPENRPIGKHPF